MLTLMLLYIILAYLMLPKHYVMLFIYILPVSFDLGIIFTKLYVFLLCPTGN